MSRENMEIVRLWIEAYNRRDMEALNRNGTAGPGRRGI